MKYQFSLSFLLAALPYLAPVNAASSDGCGNPLAAGLTQGDASATNKLTFTTPQGVQRSYWLHIPSTYTPDQPAPIIFSFHGRGADPNTQESTSGLSNETWNKNYIVVYPLGVSNQWQGDPAATGYDDVTFTLQLLDNLESNYCIDTSRLYSSGKSNGGGFSGNILACHPVASRRFAALSACSGANYQLAYSDANCDADHVPITCNAGRYPIPFITTHGDSDGTIPYNGGGRRESCLPSMPHFMTNWAGIDGFSGANTSTLLVNGNVNQFSYDNAGIVQHLRVKGMDHIWPATALGAPFDFTPMLLSFFDSYTLDNQNFTLTNATSTPSSTKATASATSSGSSASTKSSVTTTTASPVPTAISAAAPSCPASSNTIWTAFNGATFLVECGIDHAGGDMGMVYVNNLAGCLNSCANTTGCVDVSLSGQACYMKKVLGAASNNNPNLLGGKLIAPAPASSSSTPTTAVAVSSTTSTVGAASTTSTTSSSTSAVVSSTTSSTAASTSATTMATSFVTTVINAASSSTGSVGADGVTTTTFPPACTTINMNIYAVIDSLGKPYHYMCGGGSGGSTVSTVTNVANFTACFQACDDYAGCTGWTYNQGAALGAGVGQCLIKTDLPMSFASTAMLLSTRIAGVMWTASTCK